MTRDTILNAAAKLFADQGFEQTSMDSVATKAKVAKGTLYYHFKSKDEILFGIVEKGIEDFTSMLNKEIEAEQDPKKKLEIVLETQLGFFFKYRDFCKILLSEIWRFEGKWKKHIKYIQKNYLLTIKKIIEDGISCGQFNKNLDVDASSVAVFSLVSFASLDWAIFHPKRTRKEMLDTIKQIFFSGIVA